MKELQTLVAESVEARGYREGWTDEQYAARQICKAVEELRELSDGIGYRAAPGHNSPDVPTWARRLEQAGFAASVDFDDKPEDEQWNHIERIHSSVIAAELPDVIIPLLVLADTQGIDLEQAVRAKALGDIERGVRGEKPEAQEQWVPLSELRAGAVFETQNGKKGVKTRLFSHCFWLADGGPMDTEKASMRDALVREIVI